MNDRGPRRQTALQEIANESWNTELLTPVDAQLIESRPLMVFEQSLGLGDGDVGPQVTEQVRELIFDLAPFSHLVMRGANSRATFVLTYGFTGSGIGDALMGDEDNPPVIGSTSIKEPCSAIDKLDKEEKDDLHINLYAIVVLPDQAVQSIDLHDVEKALPALDARAYFFDTSDDQMKEQSWSMGDRNTGYLESLDDFGEAEEYSHDDRPGREYLAVLLTYLSRQNVALRSEIARA